MNAVNLWLEKLFKFFASLKLAVFIIISLGIISAIGTFTEARYDANYAQKLVYHSPYMYFVMALLCVNLINVMVDRLPWKPHHAGFILAHVGIITLIVGSLVTKYYGLDGSITIDIGGKSRYVMLPDTEFSIYSTYGSGNWELMHKMPADFLLRPPNGENYKMNLGSRQVQIKDYYHYAKVEQKLVESTDPQDGPAVRVQLQNANVNMTEYLVRDLRQPFTALELGPARVVMTEQAYKHEKGNEVILRPIAKTDKLNYEVYTQSKGGLTKKGVVAAGDTLETGWMGLQMRFLKYMPMARQETQFTKLDRPAGDLTTSALLVNYDGKDYWLGLNSNIRVFTDVNVFLFSFNNQRIDLGFDLHLKDFNVGRYQGTMRAASYASDVEVDGYGPAHISMNQPLKFKGFTFYQASFNETPQGEVVGSILSVNRDPGRFIKYLGSALIVLGTIVMFYFKRYRAKIFGQAKASEVQA